MSVDNINNKELNEVYTFAEAAQRYNLRDGSTLRKAVQNGRFLENEIKKVGTTWVVTKEAMDRLYGDNVKSNISGRIAAAKLKAAEQGSTYKVNNDKVKDR